MTTLFEQNKENIVDNITLGQFIKKEHTNPKRPPLTAITNQQHLARDTNKSVLLEKVKKVQDKQPLGPHESAVKLRKPASKTPSSLGTSNTAF